MPHVLESFWTWFLNSFNQSDVAAHPESVNCLKKEANDMRTPDKLVDGVNDTSDGHHSWLAPILPNNVNELSSSINNKLSSVFNFNWICTSINMKHFHTYVILICPTF